MDSSSDSDDCQLYTRTAQHIAVKKKLLEEDQNELALRMKFLPDDQVPGFSQVFERLKDLPEPPIVSEKLIIELTGSEDEIPLSHRAPKNSKRKAAKVRKNNVKKSKPSRNRRSSNNKDCDLRSTTPSNATDIPTIVFDDDTGYPTTSFAPINFNCNANKDKTEGDDNSRISLDKLLSNYDESFEDVDTLVKISVDWRNNSGHVGLNLKHFQLRRYEKFETVFEELGKLEGLPINRVVIMRKFETIRPRDTPASLNLTYYGHFVGLISKTEVDHSLPKVSDFDVDSEKPPEGDLKVKLLLDSKSCLFLTISKTQKMNVLYKKCSEELKVPDCEIKLSFDGDIVDQQDTVSDLGIEDGDVFHVLVKKGL